MSLQYIIDGYNIINHPLFARLNKHIQNPQTVLLTFIRTKRLTGSYKNKTIVVFDGYPPSDIRLCDEGNLTVIFSRKINADEKIKMLVEESANRKTIIVVSDDKEIKFMVKSLGAAVLGIEEFIGCKKKSQEKQREPLKLELTYSQMDEINQELRKIWLK